jgi:hypothetical protein
VNTGPKVLDVAKGGGDRDHGAHKVERLRSNMPGVASCLEELRGPDPRGGIAALFECGAVDRGGTLAELAVRATALERCGLGRCGGRRVGLALDHQERVRVRDGPRVGEQPLLKCNLRGGVRHEGGVAVGPQVGLEHGDADGRERG